MFTLYVLVIVALVQGGPAVFPPTLFVTAGSCETMKAVVVARITAEKETVGMAQGWCLEWTPGISYENDTWRTKI